MRKIRADDEEILLVEIGLQNFGYLLEDAQPMCSDYDRHDGRNLLENHLQERKLHFQAMLPVVRIVPAGERSLSLADEFLSRGDIDPDLAQRRSGIIV